MSSEGLKNTVLSKARAEAQAILARARAEVDGLRKVALEEAERAAEGILQRARQEALQERQLALSAFEREMQLQELEEKNRLLEECFSQAAEAFKLLPPKELRDLYRRELQESELEGAKVHVPPGSRKEFESLLNRRAAVSEDPSLEAGYVVVHRNFRLDRSLEARLQEIRAEMRPRLAALLFGGQG